MRRAPLLVPIVFALTLLASACGTEDMDDDGASSTTQPEKASVSFASPKDGAKVARRFDVSMKAEGITIEPAGEVHEGAGHLHVLVDTGCLEEGETIPRDAQHVHFGKGQLEGQLFLEPGAHELCLQLGDGAHVAQTVTEEISVTVDGSLPYVTLGVPPGEKVASPVAVTMEANGILIEPAGEVHEGAGHFHLMVDTPCVAAGQAIPRDDKHIHYGDASAQASLELAPGEHTLCLQMGDGAHTALPLTHKVTVTVG